MLRHIVLVCGDVERQHIGSLFRRHNPDLIMVPTDSRDQLLALSPTILKTARLVAFSTDIIIPAAILQALGYGAYNFHPGSPDYPGSAAACFAKYDGATRFGATMHVMAESVDSGPIIDVELFDVSPGITVQMLSEQSYGAMARLLWRNTAALARASSLPVNPSLCWGGVKTTRKMFAALCDIPPDIARDELLRRVEAFSVGQGWPIPTVTLHGVRFRLVQDDEK